MIKDFFSIGRCCGDCSKYEDCYGKHVEVNKQNTIEHPSCNEFEEK